MRAFWVLAFMAAMAAVLAVKHAPRTPGEVVAFAVEIAPHIADTVPGRAVTLAETLKPQETEYVVTLAGDTGLNGSYQLVYASFGTKKGEQLKWPDATQDIAREMSGDVNFANLETVVTDRNDIKPDLKLFAFRTHPDGVRHLVESGLDLFSTANNHTMDFGVEGARETLKHLAELGVPHAGLGANRAAARAPRLVALKDRTLALGAVGIIGNAYSPPREGEKRPGQLAYADMDEALAELAVAKADLRVLSVHYGQELEVNTSEPDRSRLTQALAKGADLVVGHHHHVVNGIEIVDGKPVFYGLGNFVHWGMQDMSRFDVCRDYGLMVRVHYAAASGERLSLRAIEAVPLTNMHRAARRLTGEDAMAKIHVLNHLARQFEGRGAHFKAEVDGTGLYCAPGMETREGKLAGRCRAAKLDPPSAELAAKIRAACSRRIIRVVENEDGLVPEFAPAAFDENAPTDEDFFPGVGLPPARR